jgi:hypothetical protein
MERCPRRHGVTLNPYDLEDRIQDIRDGYYCPNLSDLIDARGHHFARLYVVTYIWTAESDDPKLAALGDSPEEAVGPTVARAQDFQDRRPSAGTLTAVGGPQAEPGIAHLLVMHHRIVDRHRQMQFLR